MPDEATYRPTAGERVAAAGSLVTVVVAADDPFTVGAVHAFRGWERLAARVDLLELAGGGHYFLRTRPADAAQAVLRGTGQAAIA